MRKSDIISNLLGDILLPLMGFLFWGWGFYFILLFFLLDQLARVAFLPLRLKKLQVKPSTANQFFLRSLIWFIVELVIVHCCAYLQQPYIDFQHEITAFWTYEEIGFQQGWLLVPLLVLNEWMRITQEEKQSLPHASRVAVLQKQQVNAYLRMGFFAVANGLLVFVILTEAALTVGFLGFLTLLVFYPKVK
ncbi:MAG: hypothetical protein ACKO6J_06385 [Crocinitomicaceae bacterium]